MKPAPLYTSILLVFKSTVTERKHKWLMFLSEHKEVVLLIEEVYLINEPVCP